MWADLQPRLDVSMQALGQVWGRVDPHAPDLKETETPIAVPKLYGAQLLLDVWCERHGQDGFVVGRDIPSRALSNVLRNLAVFEPEDEERDFRVRIAGTALLRRFGRDITGAHMSEIFSPTMFERRRCSMLEAIRTGKPVMQDVELRQGNRKPFCFELIILPALAPDHQTAWALAGYFYHDG